MKTQTRKKYKKRKHKEKQHKKINVPVYKTNKIKSSLLSAK